ncbi:MAG: aminotransferase class V-fold PLP-dependent enzyme [Chitinophagaceae bacterium]
MKRRNILKSLTMLPFAATAFPFKSLFSAPADKTGLTFKSVSQLTAPGELAIGPNIFQSIGVEPIINCRGTFTIIGGSIERPEVRAAMEAASKDFVQYDELADGIGKRLAEITGAEWGMVSAGCAAGMKHITAACVTGGNPEKLIRIPDLAGFDKTEVVIPRSSRNTYDHAIRNIGVRIVEVDALEELENALNNKTAMIYLMASDKSQRELPLSLEAVAKIARPRKVPILVDAAAEFLTSPNIHLQRGADVVVYSGGKAICGPQCAGLVLGRKDILMSAWQASSPHHGPGRDNKVGREEMIGMLAAVEAWTKRDHPAEWKTWLSWLDHIAKKVTGIEGVTTEVSEPKTLSNKSPVLNVYWDPGMLNITGDEVAEELGRNKPRVAIGSGTKEGKTSINITTGQMQPGNYKIVTDRIYGVLSQKRVPKTTTAVTPAANLSGSWEATIEFFSSTSKHILYLEQDSNWIKGSHKGDFSVRELTGSIEGDTVKLRSVDRQAADSITFIFSGTVSGNSISGSIYMGEYRTAKFTAERSSYKLKQQKIVVPGGPPLAT